MDFNTNSISLTKPTKSFTDFVNDVVGVSKQVQASAEQENIKVASIEEEVEDVAEEVVEDHEDDLHEASSTEKNKKTASEEVEEVEEEDKKEDKEETKVASETIKFIKVANLTDNGKKFLKDYFRSIWPEDFVDALLTDK